MVAVFASFGTAQISVVRQLGLGLATAVILDAVVVRLVLMPAALVVPARVAAVRAVLVDVGGVAAWNPAFSRMSAEGSAVVGRAYPVTVRGILPGEVRYLEIGERRIETSWTFPGFAERSEWILEPVAGGTRVTHTFTHTGAVAAVLSRGFATAATLRLGRLREEVMRREVARRAA